MTSESASAPAWRCSSCGEEHSGLAFAFGIPVPVAWESATDAERDAGEINAAMCVLPADDGTEYYLRGQLELPIADAPGEIFARADGSDSVLSS